MTILLKGLVALSFIPPSGISLHRLWAIFMLQGYPDEKYQEAIRCLIMSSDGCRGWFYLWTQLIHLIRIKNLRADVIASVILVSLWAFNFVRMTLIDEVPIFQLFDLSLFRILVQFMIEGSFLLFFTNYFLPSVFFLLNLSCLLKMFYQSCEFVSIYWRCC